MELAPVIEKVERILKSRTLEGYEIYAARSRNLVIEVKDQKVDTLRFSSPAGVAVRVYTSGGMGFSYSTSLDSAPLSQMVENATVGASAQTPDQFARLPLARACPSGLEILDERLKAITDEEKISCAMELERHARAYDPRVRRTRKASYGDSIAEIAILNSHGVAGSFQATSVTASITIAAEEGNDSQMGWDYFRTPFFSRIDPKKIGEAAAANAVGLLGARKVETMRVPVVLDPRVATDILEVLAPSFLAENVQKGKSMLLGRLGEQLFSELLVIHDDGKLSGGSGTSPFDGEGYPQGRTVVVNGGRVASFLYDCRTAAKDGVESTGNSTRVGIKNPPRPGITNFFIGNGSTPSGEIFTGIERGMLITDVLGMHTANAVSGDFSVGAAGFFIEKGKPAFPVKGMALSGNIIELFRDVEMVGDDLRFFGAVGAPSLRIKALDISGR